MLLWVPTAPNIFALWVWEGTGASYFSDCLPKSEQGDGKTVTFTKVSAQQAISYRCNIFTSHKEILNLPLWAPTAPNVFALWGWGGTGASYFSI